MTKSIISEGPLPPAKTALVGCEQELKAPLADVKSPKSCALPRVAIVTKSILLVALGEYPPPKSPLVELEEAAVELVALVKLPKSCAFPVVDIVTNSITSVGVTPPPKLL